MEKGQPHPLWRVFQILSNEKREITAIYFYAILYGLVQLSLPLGIQSIIGFVLGGAISTSMVILILAVVLGVVAYGLLQVNQKKIIEKLQQQLFVRYTFRYAYTIPKLNLKQVDGYYLPEMVNRLFDSVSLQKGISKLLLDVPAATIQIVFGLILLSFYHSSFIFFGVLLLFILYLILKMTGPRGLETSIEESNYKYKVVGFLEEMARVVPLFKFSRNKAFHLLKTDELVNGYIKGRTAHFNILVLQYWILIAFKTLITAAMLVIGAYLLVEQQINIGQFISAEIVILTVIGSVEKLISNLDNIYDIITSLEKINKLIEKDTEELMEGEGKLQLNPEGQGLALKIKGLSFAYTPETPILKNISCQIAKGEKICIMGKQGSGKSTFIRVLSSIYHPYDGNILVNDNPMGMYDLQSLRSHIGVKFAPDDIFEGTLIENLSLGGTLDTYSEIEELVQIVGLQDFIEGSKDGLNKVLYTSGARLSDRIKRKISLMRALLGNPSLVLLEEPFLGMEQTCLTRIQQHLLNKMPHSTMMVIANDPLFAQQCDKVMILEGGSIKAFGTWQEVQPYLN